MTVVLYTTEGQWGLPLRARELSLDRETGWFRARNGFWETADWSRWENQCNQRRPARQLEAARAAEQYSSSAGNWLLWSVRHPITAMRSLLHNVCGIF